MAIHIYPNEDYEALRQLGVLGLGFMRQKEEKKAQEYRHLTDQADEVVKGIQNNNLDPNSAIVGTTLDRLAHLDPALAQHYAGLIEASQSNNMLGYLESESAKLTGKGDEGPVLTPAWAFKETYQHAPIEQQMRASQQLTAKGMNVKQFEPEEPSLPKILERASPEMQDKYISEQTGIAAPRRIPTSPEEAAVREARGETPPNEAAAWKQGWEQAHGKPMPKTPAEAALMAARNELTQQDYEVWKTAYQQDKAEQEAQRIHTHQLMRAGNRAANTSGLKPAEITARDRVVSDAYQANVYNGAKGPHGEKLPPLDMKEVHALNSIQLSFEKLESNPGAVEMAVAEYITRAKTKKNPGGEDPIKVYDDIARRLKSGTFGR